MASGTASKRNGRNWLLGLSGTLFTGLALASFGLLVSMNGNVASIAASMSAMEKRADRSEARWTRAYDNLDSRLRDVEFGER